ncbi:hypothetical protein D3C87_1249690 [compost metagenome]
MLTDGVFGGGIGDVRLAEAVGQFQRPGLIARNHRFNHRLALGPRMSRRHRADHQRCRLLTPGQRPLQAIEQLADAKVVDRKDQTAAWRRDTDPGAADQPVEDPAAEFKHLPDGGVTSLSSGQVGDHFGVVAIDTDDLVPGGAHGGGYGSPDSRGTAGDGCNWHGGSP